MHRHAVPRTAVAVLDQRLPLRMAKRLGGVLPLRKVRRFFDKISLYAVDRLSILVANRYQCDRRFGWWVVARQSPNRLGMIDLNGIVIPPRPHQPRHRGTLNADGEHVGEPCAGEPMHGSMGARGSQESVGTPHDSRRSRLPGQSQPDSGSDRGNGVSGIGDSAGRPRRFWLGLRNATRACGAGGGRGEWPGVQHVATKRDVVGVLERERELERIGSALEGAIAGEGGVLLVEGSAGIGKTTLALTAGDQGRSRRMRVLRAAGRELERDFPYGLVRQLFDPVLRAAGPADRERLLEGVGGAAAALHLASDGGEGAPGSEFATLYGLYWLVANLSDEGPLLLVVDDAHWADVASLRFLSFLAPRLVELPVLLLICARPDEWEPESLFAGTASDVATQPVVPAPLSREASAVLVRARFHGPVDDAFCVGVSHRYRRQSVPVAGAAR